MHLRTGFIKYSFMKKQINKVDINVEGIIVVIATANGAYLLGKNKISPILYVQ
jgi:hypothetical protein